MGGRIYILPSKSSSPFEEFKQITSIVRKGQYKYVMRISDNSISVLDLIAAKMGGATNLIMRSSNANSANARVRVLHKLFFFME